MYIVGIDFGHGETSAAVIEIEDELYANITSVEKEVPNAEEKPSSHIEDNSLEVTTNEWNAEKIKARLLETFSSLKNLNIKGDSKSIQSLMCYDRNKKKWDIGPNESKIKRYVCDLANMQNPRIAAYFKGPLVDGKGGKDSNSLIAISKRDKVLFAIFVQNVYDSIIQFNRELHRDPRNFRIYVACPSQWDEDQKGKYLAFLQKIGIPCEEVVEESRAAYLSLRNNYKDWDNPRVLVIDFGSSTIDCTYFSGKDPVIYGYQDGAHHVEEKLFDYMMQNERCAKIAYDKLVAYYDGDNNVAEDLLIHYIRNRKEKFYIDLAENGEADLMDIPLRDIVGNNKSDEGINSSDYFGFDKGYGYSEKEIEKILDEEKEEDKEKILDEEDKEEDKYIRKIRLDFEEFKNRMKNETGDDRVDFAILTGGASRMPFVKRLVGEVYGVKECTHEEREKGLMDTLLTDDDPTFSISQGTAKYGTYKTLSGPICEIIEHRLNTTWRDINWVKSELDFLIPKVAKQVYKDKLCSIIDEWVKEDSTMVSHKDETLYDVLDDIIEDKKNDDPMQIWKHVEESKEFFYENKHSLHALLRAIYNEIELKQKEKRDEIDWRMADVLTEKVNNQVKVLFEKYISIYFEKGKLSPDTSLPKFYNISLTIKDEVKRKLLIDLIEKVFEKIDKIGKQEKLVSPGKKSLNCDRDYKGGINADRCSLEEPMKEVMAEFCEAIEVKYDEKISTACKACIEKKYADIKDKCELEIYHIYGRQ